LRSFREALWCPFFTCRICSWRCWR